MKEKLERMDNALKMERVKGSEYIKELKRAKQQIKSFIREDGNKCISEVGVGDDEEIVEEDDERLTPWQCVLSAVKLSREDQADAIVEVTNDIR
ncbi:hypothetical protein QYF36_018648 [Acer negundo]|nr:hypothetical protein QYF36_018648 [Acer negundo]